mmetsp:Transcript_36009/g.26264  ORF Transcript_36009/g.26264 Transcript_36009/m.26264 type:complete len:126 (+) Transcript_36009:59-436(+)
MPQSEATVCLNCKNEVASTRGGKLVGQGLQVPQHKVKKCSFDGCNYNATGKCDFMLCCCLKGCQQPFCLDHRAGQIDCNSENMANTMCVNCRRRAVSCLIKFWLSFWIVLVFAIVLGVTIPLALT